MKKTIEEKANDWMEFQEKNPRPGSSNIFPAEKQYIPKGVTLHPVVKMVSPYELKFNPLNDFEKLAKEEYENLKADIRLNGVLDALTVKKDNTIVTGENRLRICLELLEEGIDKVKFIPVRYYMNELSKEEEYDILEGDNLFRRHLTPEQKKERLKARIKRKYKDDLEQDNRGGDRRSEKENLEVSKKLASPTPGNSVKEEISKKETDRDGSNNDPHSLIGKKRELAKKVAEAENIPLGTARNYISEIRKEIRPKKKEKPVSKNISEKDKKRAVRLSKEIKSIDSKIEGLKEEIRALETSRKGLLKELKSIGQPELFEKRIF